MEDSEEDSEEDCDEDDQGEDLIETLDYHNDERLGKYDIEDEERLDEYDLQDDFIDDRSYDDYSIASSDRDDHDEPSWTRQKKPRAKREVYEQITTDEEVPLARNRKRRQRVMSEVEKEEEDEEEEEAYERKGVVAPKLTKKKHLQSSHSHDRKTSRKKPGKTKSKSSLTSNPAQLTSVDDCGDINEDCLRKDQGLYPSHESDFV
ncbi:hypothetical protein ACER0C_025816 [Sarotherodon galilaeus]